MTYLRKNTIAAPLLSAPIIDAIRDWAFQFSAGEWNDTQEMRDYIAQEFGYKKTTPTQYAGRFIRWAVDNKDFEVRRHGHQWRWIAPDARVA